MTQNVFVLGLDAENRQRLENLPHADQLHFHPLLSMDDLVRGEIRLADLLDKAEAELDSFDGSVDAVTGYWDFPVSSMVPILCQRRGLPSASLEAVLKCEHKYWSRLEQAKAIDDHPRFALIDLQATEAPAGLRYPLWLKPVKAYSSELAFRVDDDEGLRRAVSDIRSGISRVGSPFDFALSYADLPEHISAVGGEACLAEESVSGQQVTVEGFHDGEGVHVYGVVASHCYPETSSFQRYQYPSGLPERVTDRLTTVSQRVIRQIDLRSVFNIEYFWDPDTDEINLLEINPRNSQSHAILFEFVDGVPNHHCMVELALGRTPHLPHREGAYPMAAKWFYRTFSDGFLRRVPSQDDIASIERDIPGTHVEIEAKQQTRLSTMGEQDSYSYNLACIHTGASTQDELVDKYERCIRALPFEFDE